MSSLLNSPNMRFVVCKMGLIMVVARIQSGKVYKSMLAIAWLIVAFSEREREGEKNKGVVGKELEDKLARFSSRCCEHTSPLDSSLLHLPLPPS